MARPILENEWLSIFGREYDRGRPIIQRGGRSNVGYRLTCSMCDWEQRVNGNITKARKFGRAHARFEHGVRGLYP